MTEFLAVNISERKKDFIFKDGLLAISHILTFPSAGKKVFEDGVYAANLVENHLFYYGSRDGKTFQLDLQYEDEADDSEDSIDDEDSEKIVPARNGLKYIYNVTLQN